MTNPIIREYHSGQRESVINKWLRGFSLRDQRSWNLLEIRVHCGTFWWVFWKVALSLNS